MALPQFVVSGGPAYARLMRSIREASVLCRRQFFLQKGKRHHLGSVDCRMGIDLRSLACNLIWETVVSRSPLGPTTISSMISTRFPSSVNPARGTACEVK